MSEHTVELEDIDFYYKKAVATLGNPEWPKLYNLQRQPFRGWSFYSTIAKCLTAHKLKYIDRLPYERSGAAELGIVVHHFLQYHYSNWATPEVLKEALLGVGASEDVITEAWRLFTGYINEYGDESSYWKILSVEEQIPSNIEQYASRPDLIIEILKDNIIDGTTPGIWLIDHKTRSRFDRAASTWKHDGEILGEMMTFVDTERETKGSLLPRFKGVIVNLVGKQKDQRFARIVVPYEEETILNFRKQLHYYEKLRSEAAQTNFWPRNVMSCRGEYICDHYNVCWGY